MSRLLQTSSVENEVCWPNWLTPFEDVNEVIVTALDNALARLGGSGKQPGAKTYVHWLTM